MKLSDKKNSITGRSLIVNEGIKKMHFENKISTYCPLGKNITEKTVITDIELGDYIPDLLDIEDIVKDINNGSFTNEDLLIEWKNRLMFFEPKDIKVKVCSSGHFPLYIE